MGRCSATLLSSIAGSSKISIILRPIRVQAGLGDPPSVFTTNASINALLKNKVEYRKNELPVFLDQLKEAIDEQEREVERAVIDRGKYRFRSDYRYLVKHESNCMV